MNMYIAGNCAIIKCICGVNLQIYCDGTGCFKRGKLSDFNAETAFNKSL